MRKSPERQALEIAESVIKELDELELSAREKCILMAIIYQAILPMWRDKQEKSDDVNNQ